MCCNFFTDDIQNFIVNDKVLQGIENMSVSNFQTIRTRIQEYLATKLII